MSGTATMPSGAQETPDQHEQNVETHEAYQYWGYLFKPDKTGTDKLKSLLRGLKDLINTNYEPSNNPDLTPNQLAHFYRELHGNYDQLFLGTPSESIAFIYKSLGCVHSLQPLPHSTAFTDPTVPALKTEGWIMWQTIQLLLGPEEHSSFLMEAVQKWDVKDPATGESFPKILPRQCFPLDPDKHMVAWYEGVSERLRREAEDEERQRDIEAQQAEVRRLQDRHRGDTDDEGSVDSRGPALAYFRNPLYRHVDGRPSIVRRGSKRPQPSPRTNSMVGRGKEAASTMGHVIRNIGSPHLWDGGRPPKSESKDRRRRSLPDNRFHYPGEPPPSAGHNSQLSPGWDQHRRHESAQLDRPPSASTDNEWNSPDEEAPTHSPRPSPHHRRGLYDDADATLRHSRSHEPTPSQKEYPDYFHGYDDPSRRRNSAYDNAPGGTPPPAPAANGVGPSFAPSASPLFASHLAKQPQPQQPRPPPPSSDPYSQPPRKSPSFRRAQGQRPYSQSPDPSHHSHSRDRQEHDPRRHHSRSLSRRRYDSPGPMSDGMPPPSSSGPPTLGPPQGPPPGGHSQPGFPPRIDPRAPPGDYPPYPPSAAPLPMPNPRDRRSGRHSGSDVSGPEDDRERRRSSRPRQTRFAPPAVQGVDGRRYPNESGWR